MVAAPMRGIVVQPKLGGGGEATPLFSIPSASVVQTDRLLYTALPQVPQLRLRGGEAREREKEKVGKGEEKKREGRGKEERGCKEESRNGEGEKKRGEGIGRKEGRERVKNKGNRPHTHF